MYDIRYRACVLLLLTTFAVPANASPATCEAKSGSGTVALLELYTSEGCSSCPPADRWLAELPEHGLTTDRVVPLALHVDYWNYLGWIDPFSQAAFTERQQALVHRGSARFVYTPQLLLNGREYTGWHRRDVGTDVAQLNRTPARADIALKLQRNGPALSISGTVRARADGERAVLYLALYENRLRTDVGAGENGGRTLHHAQVVRRLVGPLRVDRTRATPFHTRIELDAGWKIPDLGVTAFVQKTGATEILQALALPLCR